MDNISDIELNDMIKIVNDISNKINKFKNQVNESENNIKEKEKEKDFVLMYKQLTSLDKIRFRINHRDLYEKLIRDNIDKDNKDYTNKDYTNKDNIDKYDKGYNNRDYHSVMEDYNKKLEDYNNITQGDKMINICKTSLKRLEDDKNKIVIDLPTNMSKFSRDYSKRLDSKEDKYLESKNINEKTDNMTPRVISRLEMRKDMKVINLNNPMSRLEELEKKIREQLDEELELKIMKENEEHTNTEEMMDNDDFELDLDSIGNRQKNIDDNISNNSETETGKKRLFTERYTYEEYMFYLDLEERKRQKIGIIENKIKSLNKTDIPLRFRILSSKIPIKNKAMIIHKLDELLTARLGGGSELSKYTNWINSLLKIPFGKYINFKINCMDKPEIISNFLKNGKKTLDKAIYGHEETKEYILEIVAQWIRNPESENNMIALNGSAGTGKTCIIKEGLADVLERPFIFISLGGVSNVTYFNGHSFTYEGSTYGKIVEALMHSECMNPIIYFDELDKVGDTPHGEEIINLLIHLTDTSQNAHFNDKYFSAVPIDLSKCLFIFSFNHKEKISPILLDRLSIINVNDYKVEEKCAIGLDYLLPKIYKEYKLKNNNIKITEDNIKYIIENYTEQTGGVRPLKKCLTKIISKINYLLYTENYELFNDKDNIILDDNLIDNLIKNNKIEINISHQYMYM